MNSSIEFPCEKFPEGVAAAEHGEDVEARLDEVDEQHEGHEVDPKVRHHDLGRAGKLVAARALDQRPHGAREAEGRDNLWNIFI